MREYKKEETKALERIICNGCGKVIAVKHGMPMEGVLQVQKAWEYMSGKEARWTALICARNVTTG